MIADSLIGLRAAGRALAVAALGLAVGAGAASAATLKADYRLQDTLASSVPGAPALTNIVTLGNAPNAFVTDSVNGAPARVLAFPKANGLALSRVRSLVPSGGYSVVMLVRLTETASYRRYLDFTGGTSDNGFYNRFGSLVLYPNALGGPALIPSNAYKQIAVTRAGNGAVLGYVDATPALGPQDDSTTGAAGLTTDTLRFFKDDDAIGAEESAGAVARIRVYDGVLTPAEVAALAGGELPPPARGKSANAVPVKGEVFVKLAGGGAAAAQAKGGGFIPLSQARQIPMGSLLDTRKGVVRLTTARAKAGATQAGTFQNGLFQILQSRRKRAKGLTELRLKGSGFAGCRARNGVRGRRRRVQAHGPPLRSNARGRFRTRGRHSAATVRGTIWITADRCDGTLTQVKRGSVTVRDFRRTRNVRVRAGKSYLARAGG